MAAVLTPSLFGVLNIDKPLHHTSHDVVARIRGKLGLKKVGHCGTLDPLAEGILPVCIGDATRLIEYFPSDKSYRAHITFGKTTLTWDGEGEPVSSGPVSHLTRETIEAVLPRFKGTIQQQVPPHAAVHVNGKKLYEYARKGIAVELPVRDATLHGIRLTDFDASESPVGTFDIHCASGTYIRSIAHAMGKELGCGAYLSKLIRTMHGQFTLDTSVSLADFLESTQPASFLRNPAHYLTLNTLTLNDAQLALIQHGMKLPVDSFDVPIENNRVYLLLYGDLPAAVARGESSGRLKPLKVLPVSSFAPVV